MRIGYNHQGQIKKKKKKGQRTKDKAMRITIPGICPFSYKRARWLIPGDARQETGDPLPQAWSDGGIEPPT